MTHPQMTKCPVSRVAEQIQTYWVGDEYQLHNLNDRNLLCRYEDISWYINVLKCLQKQYAEEMLCRTKNTHNYREILPDLNTLQATQYLAEKMTDCVNDYLEEYKHECTKT